MTTKLALYQCILLSISMGGFSACSSDDGVNTSQHDLSVEAETPQNVVLFIADDYGAISAEAYADQWNSSRYAPTPTINEICSQGVRFLRAWSNPGCSPTRATVLTGRYGFRTGVGFAGDPVSPDEPSLPRDLDNAGTAHARLMSGKWHLGHGSELGGAMAPLTMGWDQYAGNVEGAPPDHYEWDRTENGVTNVSTTYTSTQEIDDAITFLESRQSDQPFVLWHAFQAPHSPLQKPPVGLHDYDDLAETGEADLDYFEAMVQAMDTEMARLLDTLPDQNNDGQPDNTTVIFVGDNGTSGYPSADARPAPYEALAAKGSLYEHGSRVPMCISGSGVSGAGRDVNAMVHTVDLYSTILELAGVDPADVQEDYGVVSDSVSLMPILSGSSQRTRDFQFTELFNSTLRNTPNGASFSNGTHKWVRTVTLSRRGQPLDEFTDECFDIVADPLEEDDLLAGNTVPQACDVVKQGLLDLVCSEPNGAWQSWCQ